MRILLEITRGEVLNDYDNINRTALHYGSAAGQKIIVELLLKNRADPESADMNGEDSRELALAAGHEEVIKLLTEGVKDSDDEEEQGAEEDGSEEQSKQKKPA